MDASIVVSEVAEPATEPVERGSEHSTGPAFELISDDDEMNVAVPSVPTENHRFDGSVHE